MDASELDKLTAEYGTLPRQFEPVSIIGTGASGVVLRAKDRLMDREVAVKILASIANEDCLTYARFTRELKLLSALDHKHIVKVLSSGLTDNQHAYQVLELLDGRTLAEELNSQQVLPAELFFKIFVQILAGLDYAHQQHVVHRDIKPSNLMIVRTEGEELCAKLIDFGRARLAEDGKDEALTATGILVGTPAYMSPEQCRGEPAQDRSDVYSLACVMYQCLCGTAPFSGGSAMEIMYKHIHEPAPPLTAADGDARLGKLLAGCLKKSPGQRPTAAEVHDDLNKLSQEYSGTTEKFQERGSFHHRVILVVPVALLLVAVLSVCIFVFRHNFMSEPPSFQTPVRKLEDESLKERKSLLEDINRMQKRFDRLKLPKERGEQGLLLCKKIETLCEYLFARESVLFRDQKTVQQLADDRAGLYRRILGICQRLDPDETLETRLKAYSSLAAYECRMRHYDKALDCIENGRKLARTKSMKMEMAELDTERAKLEIEFHDLKAARVFAEEAMKLWASELDQRIRLPSMTRRNQGEVNTEERNACNILRSVTYALRIEHYATEPQQTEALELCNQLTGFLLQRSGEASREAVEDGLALLASLPSDSSSYRKLAAQTYRLAAKEAALRKDKAAAARFKKLAAPF
jgi:serine/threonine protein kinase